jgi:hypothetical protein
MNFAKKPARVFVFALLLIHASGSFAVSWPQQGHMPQLVTWGLAGLSFGGDVVTVVGSGLALGAVAQIIGLSTLECLPNTACAENLSRVQASANWLLASTNNVVAMGIAAGLLGLVYDIVHFGAVTIRLSNENGIIFGRRSKDFCAYGTFWALPRAGLYALALASIFYPGVSCDEQCMQSLPSDAQDGINQLYTARMKVALPGVAISVAATLTSVALIFISYNRWFMH